MSRTCSRARFMSTELDPCVSQKLRRPNSAPLSRSAAAERRGRRGGRTHRNERRGRHGTMVAKRPSLARCAFATCISRRQQCGCWRAITCSTSTSTASTSGSTCTANLPSRTHPVSGPLDFVPNRSASPPVYPHYCCSYGLSEGSVL